MLSVQLPWWKDWKNDIYFPTGLYNELGEKLSGFDAYDNPIYEHRHEKYYRNEDPVPIRIARELCAHNMPLHDCKMCAYCGISEGVEGSALCDREQCHRLHYDIDSFCIMCKGRYTRDQHCAEECCSVCAMTRWTKEQCGKLHESSASPNVSHAYYAKMHDMHSDKHCGKHHREHRHQHRSIHAS